jgi:hypothetical protein
MFRVSFPIRAAWAAGLLTAFALAAGPADAGQLRFRGGAHHHAPRISSFSANRARHGFASRHIRRGRQSARAGRHGRALHRGHYRRHRHYGGSGSVAIVIGGAGAATGNASGMIVQNGRCAAGRYCTLRLGPYTSSPKIITLNDTGETITRGTFEKDTSEQGGDE